MKMKYFTVLMWAWNRDPAGNAGKKPVNII
jgi:hypothetical protein